MRRFIIILLVIVVAGGGYLLAAHLSGGALFTFGLPLGGDSGYLRDVSRSFWEDVQFKDFKRAATYHTEGRREKVDISYLIERLFMIKPELLDIMDYEIIFSRLDSTGLRGRVKTNLRVKNLATKKIRMREVMLYWHRKTADSPWYMELETSLRKLDFDKGKKH